MLRLWCNQDRLDLSQFLKATNIVDTLATLTSTAAYPTFETSSTFMIRASKELDKMRKNREAEIRGALPKHWWFVHGDKDGTVPVQASVSFHSVFKRAQCERVLLSVYENIDHSQPIVGKCDGKEWNGRQNQ